MHSLETFNTCQNFIPPSPSRQSVLQSTPPACSLCWPSSPVLPSWGPSLAWILGAVFACQSQREAEGQNCLCSFQPSPPCFGPCELHFLPWDSSVFPIIFSLWFKIKILLPIIQRTWDTLIISLLKSWYRQKTGNQTWVLTLSEWLSFFGPCFLISKVNRWTKWIQVNPSSDGQLYSMCLYPNTEYVVVKRPSIPLVTNQFALKTRDLHSWTE